MGIQLPCRQKPGFSAYSKESRMEVEDTKPLLPSAFHKSISIKKLYILINGLCNTLKLAIFALCVIYVLRLINILKHGIFFLKSKIGRNILVAFL
jgi:hypothetical protein